MPIRFACPACRAALSVADKYGERTGRCPRCGQAVKVPIPVAEEEPEEILDVLPVPETPQLHGRLWLWSCEHCQRSLRTPFRESGKIISCPSCRLFLKAPGKRQDRATGLPVRLCVSAWQIAWPPLCPCCLEQHDTFIKISKTRVNWRGASNLAGVIGSLASAKTQGWSVPYCWPCIAHVNRNDESRCKRQCVAIREAIGYEGWYGTTHRFRFDSWRYANLFIGMNRDKLLLD